MLLTPELIETTTQTWLSETAEMINGYNQASKLYSLEGHL